METRSPSPDDKYIFQIDMWEARMSHWIESPRLIKAATSEVVFDLIGTNWSLDSAEWLDVERVKLVVRCYPGDHSPSSFEMLIDCSSQQATIQSQIPIALTNLKSSLEANYLGSQTKHIAGNTNRLANLRSLFAKIFK